MSYTKQNFQPKQPLTAAAMNQIEAGIVANEEAIAAAKNSLLGYETFAGGKGFTITAVADNDDGSTGNYTLSSVTGLEVGMRYSAVLSSANYNAGKITAINANTNIVTVDGYKHIELNSKVDDPENFNVYNCFLIVDRPDLGDKEVGFNAHAEGENTIASNKDAHAEGYKTKAIGKFAHAEGNNTIAGHGAHAEGSNSQALGDISHAEGNNTKARGKDSHAEGNNTETGSSATGSHAEGVRSKVYAVGSHAEGIDTIASNDAAHAEGSETQAIGTASHAGGQNSIANNAASFVHGSGLKTNADNQFVVGAYNEEDPDAIFIVGGGSEDKKRKNLFTVKKSGEVISSLPQGPESANALKETVSGEYLVIDNFSPLSRTMTIRVPQGDYYDDITSVVVRQYGKNIINMDNFLGTALSKDENGIYTFVCTNTYVSPWYRMHIPAGVPLTFSFEGIEVANISSGGLRMQIQTDNGNHWLDIPVNPGLGRTSKTITTKGNVTQIQVFIDSSNGKTACVKFKEPQFELNNIATEYEPYKEFVANAPDGYGIIEGMVPFYPVTTLIPSVAGATMECTYSKDINKLFNNITDPVIFGTLSMNRRASRTVGEYSSTLGKDSVAEGEYAHAEGYRTEAIGESSHAEGNDSRAYGDSAHAEGHSVAHGDYSHAGGLNATTNYTASFAHGSHVSANAEYQAVFGSYNKVNTDAAFMIGNGQSASATSNAFEVNYDGNAYVQQNLFVGGTGTNQSSAKEVATKNDVEAAKTDIKNDLLNGAGTAYDTLKELGDLIDENNDAIAALETVATNKADKSNTVVTGSFSMGRKAGTTVGNNSFAVGTDVTASGTNSSAEGKDTTASGMHSHAEGHISQATGYGAHAENGQTKAIGGYSHAEGYLSEAQGDNSHSEGMKTKAIGNNSHASGQETKAEGANSVAAGHATQAIGNNSFATGAETKASSPDTFTAGLLAKAGGKAFQVSSRIEMPSQDGFAVGGYVVNSMTGLQTAFNEAAAQGQMLYYIAHIEADDYYELGNIIDITRMPNTIIGAGIGLVTPKSDVEKMVIPSVGNYLMIMGCPELGDIEVGLAAFAEGIDTRAQHRGAHVEGISAISAGPGAHAEGILARAVHFGSHAEGFSTIAGGAYSHAGGYASETGADHAFAHGEKVYAYEKNQTVFGQYNQMNPNAAFIVGNGSDDTSRSNAIEILKNGDAIVSKDLYVNGTSKVATTNDLDSLAAELDNIKTKIAAALNKTVEELFG